MADNCSRSSVVSAINAAQKELQKADKLCEKKTLAKNFNVLSTKEPTLSQINASTKTESNADNTPYDPDDLAAAFFAAEAQKKEQSKKLPTEDWSALFPGLSLANDEIMDKVINFPENEDEETKQLKEMTSQLRIAMKTRLVNIFMNEIIEGSKSKMNAGK